MNLDYLKLVSLDGYVPYYTLHLWEKYNTLYSSIIFKKTVKLGYGYSKREIVIPIERKKNEER